MLRGVNSIRTQDPDGRLGAPGEWKSQRMGTGKDFEMGIPPSNSGGEVDATRVPTVKWNLSGRPVVFMTAAAATTRVQPKTMLSEEHTTKVIHVRTCLHNIESLMPTRSRVLCDQSRPIASQRGRQDTTRAIRTFPSVLCSATRHICRQLN